jgi:membrane protease subunit HflK
VSQAEGERINRVNSAKGDVARFSALLAEYRKAPDVTRRRLYLETMREILPAVGQTYVFDADQPASLLPFLDLKQSNRLPMTPPAEMK